MNCKRLAKYLPELVAGELDEKMTRLAEEHIRSCAACAAERAAYERALGALCNADAEVEVPAALDFLNIPDERPARRMWLQPAMATVALAAVLALVVLMPHPYRPVPEVTKPPQVATTQPEQQTPDTRQPKIEVQKPKPVEGHRNVLAGNAYEPRAKTVATVDVPNPPPSPGRVDVNYDSAPSAGSAYFLDEDRLAYGTPVHKYRDRDMPEPSAIVVAYDPGDDQPPAPVSLRLHAGRPASPVTVADAVEQPAPSVVEIESTDPGTGAITVYNYSRDSEGRERIIEMTSNVCASPVGGTNQ